MPDLSVNLSNSVASVGGMSQKQIGSNAGRPNNASVNIQNGQDGRVSNTGINTRDIDSAAAGNINEIKENAVKTIRTDIVQKALRDADIEVTQATLDIVKSLVNGSLPLTDKNIINLLEYSRIFKDVSTDNLALMMRLEIPITADNVEQFEKLTGANENLSDKISSLINGLPQEILQNSAGLSALSENLSRLLDIIADKDAGGTAFYESLANSGNSTAVNEPVLDRYGLNSLLGRLRDLKAPDNVLNQIIIANRQNQNIPFSGNISEEAQLYGNALDFRSRADVILDIINEFIRGTASEGQNLQNVNNGAGGAPDNDMSASGRAGESEIFAGVKDLINSGEFQKLLRESVEEKWLINPKNLNPGKIEDFYNKLNEKLNGIENRFAELVQDNRGAVRDNALPQAYLNAKDIRDSLSLMNEISKTMPFMQIPLKFANRTVNSDLYIFKNKKKNKNGADSAGSINALLRLNLENAGDLDIYINMSGKNVRSRFYSKNIKSISEIEKNLPELNETIAKMGFNFRGVTSSDEKGFDFVGDFINRGVPKAEIRKYILNMKI